MKAKKEIVGISENKNMLIEVPGKLLDYLKNNGVSNVKEQKKLFNNFLTYFIEINDNNGLGENYMDDYKNIKIRKDIKIVPDSNDLSVDEWLKAVDKK
jgi:hypothetical protein